MFTIDQIKTAHAKVKSGADFPAYIQELIQLGVTSYETFVTDGHTDYSGANGFTVSSPSKYAQLVVAENSNKTQFVTDLKTHQQGGSDYLTFCNQCAESGIEKWEVDMGEMICTYFDKAGNEILTEVIPG